MNKLDELINKAKKMSNKWNTLPEGESEILFLSDALKVESYPYEVDKKKQMRHQILFNAILETKKPIHNKVTGVEHLLGLNVKAASSLSFFLKVRNIPTIEGLKMKVKNFNRKRYEWGIVERVELNGQR